MEPKDKSKRKEAKKTSCPSSSEKKLPGNSTGQKKYSKEGSAVIAKYEAGKKDSPSCLNASLKNSVWHVGFLGSPEDYLAYDAKIAEATGTADRNLGLSFISQVIDTYFFDKGDGTKIVDHFNKTLALLSGIKPQDELEGMLAAQMIGTHNLAMGFLRRAMINDQRSEDVSENINRATKLLRTYTAQVEALSKYRNRGQQKVTVEHVHVNAGGQAVVGIVNPKPGGDSGNK